MTEYHFIVLKGDQLYAVNRVSGRVVSEVVFRSPLTKNVSGEPSRSIGEGTSMGEGGGGGGPRREGERGTQPFHR